jgi:hypothetical protein
MIKQEIFDKVFDNERYANRIVDDYEIAAFNRGYTFDKGSFVKVVPDDKLNCAESWRAFGNYKEHNIPATAKYYTLRAERFFDNWFGWQKKDKNAKDYIYIPEIGKAFEITNRGFYNPSEDNTTPVVETFGKEVDTKRLNLTDDILDYLENDKDELLAKIEKLQKNFALEKENAKLDKTIYNLKEELDKQVKDLEVFKKEHPGAKKSIARFEEIIDKLKISIEKKVQKRQSNIAQMEA